MMMRLLVKSRHRLVSNATLIASFVNFLSPTICYTQSAEDPYLTAFLNSESEQSGNSGPSYTVNFNNVPVIEVIRFVSKITNMNFVFSQDDIQFNVSIISEEPITVKNILSALIQVLRINNLVLLEQDNSLIITKNQEVHQIPTIVSGDIPNSEQTTAPLITRVFRIKNANASSIANIIRTMTSKGAQIEVSNETRQLIVTDITTNVDKIASLLSSLDAPHTPLEIDSYQVRNVPPADIIALATPILSPFTEGNPLIFVPQDATSTVFIVSTPYLLERAITVMEDLDILPKEKPFFPSSALPQQVFFYPIENRSYTEIMGILSQTSSDLATKDPVGSSLLIEALKSASYIPETHSLRIITDATTWTTVKSILSSADIANKNTEKVNFLYTAKYRSVKDILQNLQQTARTTNDEDLIGTIQNVHLLTSNNSLFFTGNQSSINQIQIMLANLDADSPETTNVPYVYPVQNIDGSLLFDRLKKTVEAMNDSGLIKTVSAGKWIPEIKSLVFSGPSSSITKIKDLLSNLDTPPNEPKNTQFLYNVKNKNGQILLTSLQKAVEAMNDRDLIKTASSGTWIQDINSLAFNGSEASIAKITNLLPLIDTPDQAAPPSTNDFLNYTPKYQDGESLLKALDDTSESLKNSGLSNPALIETLKSARWIKSTQTLVFTGDASSLEKIKFLLAEIDNPDSPLTENETLIYKPLYKSQTQLETALTNFANNLNTKSPSDQQLKACIQGAHWVSESKSFIFRGEQPTLERMQYLLSSLDNPSGDTAESQASFYVYQLKNAKPDNAISYLQKISSSLSESQANNSGLANSIANIKSLPEHNQLLISGSQPVIDQIKLLLDDFDASSQDSIGMSATSTILVYQILYADPSTFLKRLLEATDSFVPEGPIKKLVSDSVSSGKYNPELKTFTFIGSSQVLGMIKSMAQQLDVDSSKTSVKRTAASHFFVYNPKNIEGTDLIKILHNFMDTLKSSQLSNPELYETIDHLKYIKETNSLIITGSESSMQQVSELLERFDVSDTTSAQTTIQATDTTHFLVYKLQYHQGAEILTALKEVASSISTTATASSKSLIDAIGSLQWVEVTNSLIASGESGTLSKLKALIENVDVPLRQVFIEVLVVETDLFNSQNFGLQWGSQLQYLNKTIGAMGNFPVGPNASGYGDSAVIATPLMSSQIGQTTASTPPVQGGTSLNQVPFATGFDLGVIGDLIFHKGKSFLSLGSLVNALQIDRDSTVVMNPKIITQDGHTSTIFVGQNIPFTGSFVSNTGSNATVQTSNIEYRDVGVNLTITPTLGSNNIITLDIAQDISEQVPGTTSVQGSTVTGIQTAHTTMNTRVHVPDNHFLVLSGMIQNSKTNFSNGIPCLGGLPVVGALFAQNDRSATKTNVIIFVRPIIINSFEDYDRITEEEEAMFKENAVKQVLKEEFDQATEMIKALSEE
ncbi:MAG: hypothetical protein NT065_06655 [Chlamydiae bacterium]|nr:hypothetical protein [Chlamydiota bacterium]